MKKEVASPDSNEGMDFSNSSLVELKPPSSAPSHQPSPSSVTSPAGECFEENPMQQMPRHHQDILRKIMDLQNKLEYPDENDVRKATVSSLQEGADGVID